MLRDKIGEELFAALFPATVEAMNITPALFMQELSEWGIRCTVEWFRLKLEGGPPQERERLIGIVHSNPDLEARIILRIAMTDSDVMGAIEERACIRWVEGYSDSLYSAVRSGIKPVEETLDDAAARDEKQVAFLRSMGIPSGELRNPEAHPSVWRKRKPKTDWEAERREYEV